MAIEIYLIRHGETDANKNGTHLVSGRCPTAQLTKEGITQAQALGQYLKQKGIKFDKAYTSPLIRTKQTAQQCLGTICGEVEQAEELTELTLGEWEGKPKTEVYTPEIKAELNKNNWNYKAPKGESQKEVYERVRYWIEKNVTTESNENKKIGIFTHGLAIKMFLAGLFNLDKSTAYTIPIDNTSITKLKYEKGNWEELTRNNTEHLQNKISKSPLGSF
jgi:broad specificity phosphatase PhoE